MNKDKNKREWQICPGGGLCVQFWMRKEKKEVLFDIRIVSITSYFWNQSNIKLKNLDLDINPFDLWRRWYKEEFLAHHQHKTSEGWMDESFNSIPYINEFNKSIEKARKERENKELNNENKTKEN